MGSGRMNVLGRFRSTSSSSGIRAVWAGICRGCRLGAVGVEKIQGSSVVSGVWVGWWCRRRE